MSQCRRLHCCAFRIWNLTCIYLFLFIYFSCLLSPSGPLPYRWANWGRVMPWLWRRWRIGLRTARGTIRTEIWYSGQAHNFNSVAEAVNYSSIQLVMGNRAEMPSRHQRHLLLQASNRNIYGTSSCFESFRARFVVSITTLPVVWGILYTLVSSSRYVTAVLRSSVSRFTQMQQMHGSYRQRCLHRPQIICVNFLFKVSKLF